MRNLDRSIEIAIQVVKPSKVRRDNWCEWIQVPSQLHLIDTVLDITPSCKKTAIPLKGRSVPRVGATSESKVVFRHLLGLLAVVRLDKRTCQKRFWKGIVDKQSFV